MPSPSDLQDLVAANAGKVVIPLAKAAALAAAKEWKAAYTDENIADLDTV